VWGGGGTGSDLVCDLVLLVQLFGLDTGLYSSLLRPVYNMVLLVNRLGLITNKRERENARTRARERDEKEREREGSVGSTHNVLEKGLDFPSTAVRCAYPPKKNPHKPPPPPPPPPPQPPPQHQHQPHTHALHRPHTTHTFASP
jgi:hypothetical protein